MRNVRKQFLFFRRPLPKSDASGDWTKSSAYFKGEKGVLNIGLGKGKGLDIFNQNIVSFKQVGKNVKR